MVTPESSRRARAYNALDKAWNEYQISGSIPPNLSPETKELLIIAIAIGELSKVSPPDPTYPSQKAAAREKFLSAAGELRQQTAAVQEKKVA